MSGAHALVLLVALLPGCAVLGSKAELVEIHQYTPEVVADAPRAAQPADRPAVRLGRVTSSAHLRRRIVWRASAHELGAYEDHRWTDDPEVFVVRAVSRALFEEGGHVQAIAGRGPTLDLEVVAFEEVRRGDRRSGLVQIAWSLHDDTRVFARGVATAEEPAEGRDGPNGVAAAVGAALGAAADEIAGQVDAHLAGGAP